MSSLYNLKLSHSLLLNVPLGTPKSILGDGRMSLPSRSWPLLNVILKLTSGKGGGTSLSLTVVCMFLFLIIILVVTKRSFRCFTKRSF